MVGTAGHSAEGWDVLLLLLLLLLLFA